jgi:hypothetical protein
MREKLWCTLKFGATQSKDGEAQKNNSAQMCALLFSTARCGLGGTCIILVCTLSIVRAQKKFVGAHTILVCSVCMLNIRAARRLN